MISSHDANHGAHASAAGGTDDPSEPTGHIVVPSADVLAIVRFAEPPEEAAVDLQPYVVLLADTIPDWVLTDDAVAFGTPDVIERFAAWRSTWERTWVLDPASSVARLFDLIQTIEPATPVARLVRGHLDDDDDLIIPPAQQTETVAFLARLAERIRARNAQGYGIVDRTPGADRVGLARAWPAHGGGEIVAADDHTTIHFDPDAGIFITTSVGPRERRGARSEP